jgi:antitoxin component YwqK of YwqJK toxin-antitoxin module
MIRLKRLIFILGFMACFISADKMTAQKFNQFDENKNRTGVWRKYYSNKRIRYQGKFVNGKEVGVFKFYDRSISSFPIIIKNFSSSSDSLFVQFFTLKGILQSEGAMNGKQREGTWYYYFVDGKILSEENYTNGKLEGEVVNYYPDGKVAERSIYKNGLKNGLSRKYSNKEICIEEVVFALGKENGLAKYFELDGNLKEAGTYKEGSRVGEWAYYLEGEIAPDSLKKAQRGTFKKKN